MPAIDWLTYLNQYRSTAKLPVLIENPSWSVGAAHHSRYMVRNGLLTHSEDPLNPWYTPDGALAGQHGNVFGSSDQFTPPTQPIDAWLAAPFHALWILYPGITEVGYGFDAEVGPGWLRMAATLQMTDGGPLPMPPGIVYPIEWPGHGATVALAQYGGGELPDPLTACPGYTVPVGLPLIVQFAGPPAQATSYSVSEGGTSLAACAFDQTGYTNPDPGQQSVARSILAQGNAVVVIPREPLQPGQTYTVTVTTTTQLATWSFQIS
ncbi:MAG TPA: CAP domain-containing protein [Chloroflexota bacterium]|nr:CAP domain-containing protein [Chloroflexota bacterium]